MGGRLSGLSSVTKTAGETYFQFLGELLASEFGCSPV